MKRITTISLIAVASFVGWFLSCERNMNKEPDDQQPADTVIRVSYIADNSKSVSSSINAASGGSIQAEDKFGVTFELTIPPGALKNNTSITITPLQSFSISGAGGSSCKECTGSEENCCHHGILLEPSGLQLDSSATLTVRFPAGSFPFEGSGLIVYIDSAVNSYSSYPTQTNTAERTLTAQIRHFSGYGTDETNKERTRREIIEKCRKLDSKVGTDEFYLYLYDVDMMHWLDGFTGPGGEEYSDLVALLESLMLQIWSKQVSWILARYSGKATCDAIERLGGADYSLSHYIGWHNGSSFATLRTSIRNTLLTALGQSLEKGRALCQMDSCMAGIELLSCARAAYIGSGFEEPTLIEALNQNLGTCCKGQITISADKTSIRMHPLSRTNLSDCYAVITAVVTGADGKPIENIGVWFGSDYPNTAPDGGTTDAEGKVKTVITGSNAGEFDELGNSECTFVAHAYVGGSEILSEPLTITFKMPTIELKLKYDLSYSQTFNSGYSSLMTISINGNATRLASTYPSNYTCSGGFSRSYNYSASTGTETITGTIHPDFTQYPRCPFDILLASLERILLPEGNYKYTYYIKDLIFYPTDIFLFDIIECHNPGTCMTKRLDNWSSDFILQGFVGGYKFENNGGGEFPELIWSNSVTSETTNLSASLNVQISVNY